MTDDTYTILVPSTITS